MGFRLGEQASKRKTSLSLSTNSERTLGHHPPPNRHFSVWEDASHPAAPHQRVTAARTNPDQEAECIVSCILLYGEQVLYICPLALPILFFSPSVGVLGIHCTQRQRLPCTGQTVTSPVSPPSKSTPPRITSHHSTAPHITAREHTSIALSPPLAPAPPPSFSSFSSFLLHRSVNIYRH